MSIVFRNTPLSVRVSRRARSAAEHPAVGAALVTLAIVIAIVVLSANALRRYEGLHFATHELGTISQLTANLRHGRFDLTVDAPEGGGAARTFARAPGSLLLLSGLQAGGANPGILLVAQALALALGAWPIYALAATYLGGHLRALLIACAYLVYPPLARLALGGFSTGAFAIPPLLLAALALDRRKHRQAILWLAVAALMRWESLFVAIGFGLALAITRPRRRLGVDIAGGSALLLMLGGSLGGGYADLATATLAGGRDWTRLGEPLLALLGLPLLSLPGLLAGLPLLAARALVPTSGGTVQLWSGALAFAPLFVGTIAGIRTLGRLGDRLAPRRGSEEPPHALYRAAALAVLLSCVAWSALGGPWPTASAYDARIDRVTAHERRAVAFFAKIPAAASLSAQDNLAPRLADRAQLARFPRLDRADYVLLDVRTAEDAGIPVADYVRSVIVLLENPDYGVSAQEDGYLLLQRGLPQRPLADTLAALYTQAYPNEAFTRGVGRVLADPNARHGQAAVAVAPVDGAGYLATNLHVALPAGTYTATFRMRPGWNGDTNPVAIVDVVTAGAGATLVRREVSGGDFRTTEYQEISVDFTVTDTVVSPRLYWAGKTELWFDSLSIAPTTVTIARWRVASPR
jgi:hypothetical protein